jgi:hypothetical protein
MSLTELRPDIAEPPKFMQELPIFRGYPVPWFVDWIGGVPEFRAMDMRKFKIAINDRRCWVCGNKLFGEEIFTIGPMCLVNRISSEPPAHRECAQYSAINCPFLSKPHMVRREDENFNAAKKPSAGIMVARNPGVTLLYYTRRHELLSVPGKPGIAAPGILFRLGKPFLTEWYSHGRRASRDEVLLAVESGLPILRETSMKLDGPQGSMILETQIAEAMRLLPK